MPPESALYLDSDTPVDERIKDLLNHMTLSEKVGQLVGTVTSDLDDIREKITDHHIGIASPFGHGLFENNTPSEAATLANEVQTFTIEKTRLGIPLLFHTDADHGHARISGATVFPHNLGMAATRNADLQERAAAVTAREIAATGAHQNLNPVADVGREPRWGRTYETYGESPSLCAEMSAAKVRGYQGNSLGDEGSVVATPKHFPAYGEPTRGEDASPVDISEYTFRRTFLPPFEAVIEAGAESIMPCYNELDGEPVHGSRRYLTDLLRNELNFDGYAVSDWGGVHMLHEDHHTAESMEEAIYQTTTASLDVASVAGPDYAETLLSLVSDGHVAEARIDASVRRVLSVKFRLGLFEDPLVDSDEATERLLADEHREVTLRAARESLTLLKNENDLLPLDPDLDEVLVAGPNADNIAHQFGGWSSVEDPIPPATTLRAGVESVVGKDTMVTYEQGTTLREELDFEETTTAAERADAAVVAIGEGKYVHEFGESFGEASPFEFPNRMQLDLPDAQRELVERVMATGTPTVVVLVTGRPLAIRWIADHAPTILMAYYPGTDGGQAVAEAVFGEYNPGGALPISVPRSAGHLPTRFNYRPHPRPVGHESDDGTHLDSYDPLFEFGHGLSYTEFEYDNLTVQEETVGPQSAFEVSVTVTNVGDRAGDETVDLFVTDEYSSRVTPVRELVGFDRVSLDPDESETVIFDVDAESDLGVVQNDGNRLAESGTFEFSVGDLSESLRIERRYR